MGGRLGANCLILLVLAISAANIFWSADPWPLPRYAMFSRPIGPRSMKILVAYGITPAGAEFPLLGRGTLAPLHSGLEYLPIHKAYRQRPDEDRLDEVLRALMRQYEKNRRRLGKQRWPDITGIRLYRLGNLFGPSGEFSEFRAERELVREVYR